MLSIDELVALVPSKLTTVADGLTRARRRLVSQQDECDDGRPPASWIGESAAAARDGHQRLVNSLNDLVAPVSQVVHELDHAAAVIERAQSEATDLREQAQAKGLTLSAPDADHVTVAMPEDARTGIPRLPDVDQHVVGREAVAGVSAALRRADAAVEALRGVLAAARRGRYDGGTGELVEAGPRRLPPELRGLSGRALAERMATKMRARPERYRPYLMSLSPAERQAYLEVYFEDFDPSEAITPGAPPPWASGPCLTTVVDGVRTEYGYVAGGSIPGPDGRNWPIVMPYMDRREPLINPETGEQAVDPETGEKAFREVRYMDDTGSARADGGIRELDGRDPGWTTVASYSGNHEYQDISGWVALAGAINGLDGNRVYPGIVNVSPDGTASVGEKPSGDAEPPALPPTYSDPEAKYRAPGYAPGRAVVLDGAVGLMRSVLGVADTIGDVASHEERPWHVEYQVNDDGRVRAMVRTYQAGIDAGGTPVVGSFANTFAEAGSTDEYAYARRVNGTVARPQGVTDTTLSAVTDTDSGGSAGYSRHRDVEREIDLF